MADEVGPSAEGTRHALEDAKVEASAAPSPARPSPVDDVYAESPPLFAAAPDAPPVLMDTQTLCTKLISLVGDNPAAHEMAIDREAKQLTIRLQDNLAVGTLKLEDLYTVKVILEALFREHPFGFLECRDLLKFVTEFHTARLRFMQNVKNRDEEGAVAALSEIRGKFGSEVEQLMMLHVNEDGLCFMQNILAKKMLRLFEHALESVWNENLERVLSANIAGLNGSFIHFIVYKSGMGDKQTEFRRLLFVVLNRLEPEQALRILNSRTPTGTYVSEMAKIILNDSDLELSLYEHFLNIGRADLLRELKVSSFRSKDATKLLWSGILDKNPRAMAGLERTKTAPDADVSAEIHLNALKKIRDTPEQWTSLNERQQRAIHMLLQAIELMPLLDSTLHLAWNYERKVKTQTEELGSEEVDRKIRSMRRRAARLAVAVVGTKMVDGDAGVRMGHINTGVGTVASDRKDHEGHSDPETIFYVPSARLIEQNFWESVFHISETPAETKIRLEAAALRKPRETARGKKLASPLIFTVGSNSESSAHIMGVVLLPVTEIVHSERLPTKMQLAGDCCMRAIFFMILCLDTRPKQ